MMRYFLLLCTVILFSCSQNDRKKPDEVLSVKSSKENIEADNPETINKSNVVNQEIEYQIGIDFLNSYIKNCNKMNSAIDIVSWTKKSEHVTDNFKNQLEKLVSEAFSIDSVLGLGFDPIFNAQDYPEKGVEMVEFNEIKDEGYLRVRGVEWEDFQLIIKLINQKGKTLVDGCGIVNVPKDQRLIIK